jgi:hypothetical protein
MEPQPDRSDEEVVLRVTFTEQELAEMDREGVTLDEVIRSIEQSRS